MIFNRWFWFSIFASVLAQSIQWRPALAADACADPKAALETFMSRNLATDTEILSAEFRVWAADFDQRLKKTLSKN